VKAAKDLDLAWRAVHIVAADTALPTGV